ncbi:LysE family translocator [Photobacterium sanctipauli]|uniref:LysE family translocator n=1 Tax=Photobacterium sanctipauli TaxID=1342794 RepID=A0A2T3NV06_9GAMM|nr:LysE family translocator [Photobacterium sanctipauli]PSW20103.1 LysE family translocator [Photobacterium sanctipauli]
MPFENWLAFIAASAVFVAIPGPTILLTISYALTHGRSAAIALVSGVVLGDLTAMLASLLGLGAILSSSAELFSIVKWMGAIYLVYLGVKLYCSPIEQEEGQQEKVANRLHIFRHAYIVTLLNPKSIVFFVAFFPQFLDTTQPLVPQMIVQVVTFLCLALLALSAYGISASLARHKIRSPSVQKWINRVGGSLIVGAGVTAAGLQR